jgi:hypothetical protein
MSYLLFWNLNYRSDFASSILLLPPAINAQIGSREAFFRGLFSPAFPPA